MPDDRPSPEARLEELRPRLLAAVRRSCPRWLAESAEDICQEALVRLARRLEADGERADAPSPSYLKKTAYNAVIDAIRAHRGRRTKETELDRDVPATDSASAGAERLAVAAEIGVGIRDCLTRMTRLRRIAVTLHLQGHTLAEASRLLGWPQTRTTNLVYRGLKDLRACLAAKGMKP